MTGAQPFHILYVCTGNIARSPLAAACTQAVVSRDGGPIRWSVTSAGTHAEDGDTVRAEVTRVAERLGLDLSGHRSRSLEVGDCDRADLILAMAWDQVSHIWSLVPTAWERCFTIKEFVHWAKQAPVRPPILFPNEVEQMRDKVAQAHAVRKKARAELGFWGGMRPQDLNLTEPTGRSDVAWRNFGHAVRLLVSDVLHLLGGPPPAPESQTKVKSGRRAQS